MSDANAPQPGMTASVPGRSLGEDNLLRHYTSVLRRRWRWVVLGVGVGLIAGIVSAVFFKPTVVTTRYYKATNTLTQVNPSGTGGTAGSNNYTLDQAALQIQSQQLLNSVARTVHMTPDEVAVLVNATVRPNVNAIDVTAISTDPQVAVRVANTAANVLLLTAESQAGNTTQAQRTKLQDQLDSLNQQRDTVEAQPASTPSEQLLKTQQLQQIDANIQNAKGQIAALPESGGGFTLSVLRPATPIQINAKGYNFRHDQNVNARNQLGQQNNTINNNALPDFDELDLSTHTPVGSSTRVALGALAGLLLGLISAFVIEAWDDRVRRRDDVEQLTGLGVLTEIPKMSREEARDHHVAVEDEPSGVTAERYRTARTAIAFAMAEQLDRSADRDDTKPAPILMVTSPGPAEGKTTTVANLACAFADEGRRVLVIDGDFRRPAVHRYLTPVPNLVTPDAPGKSRFQGVWYLAGPRDAPTPEAAIEQLIGALAKWRSGCDLVILDTPPILTTNDAVDLLAASDAVLLVLRAGRTRSKATQRVAEVLTKFRADTLGVVLNDCDKTEMNQYYGSGYGYNYGYVGSSKAKVDDPAQVETVDSPN